MNRLEIINFAKYSFKQHLADDWSVTKENAKDFLTHPIASQKIRAKRIEKLNKKYPKTAKAIKATEIAGMVALPTAGIGAALQLNPALAASAANTLATGYKHAKTGAQIAADTAAGTGKVIGNKVASGTKYVLNLPAKAVKGIGRGAKAAGGAVIALPGKAVNKAIEINGSIADGIIATPAAVKKGAKIAGDTIVGTGTVIGQNIVKGGKIAKDTMSGTTDTLLKMNPVTGIPMAIVQKKKSK